MIDDTDPVDALRTADAFPLTNRSTVDANGFKSLRAYQPAHAHHLPQPVCQSGRVMD